ncbi:MAG: hypothetical protein V4692_04765 [Bdellovibrionota bacterium]
MTSFSGCSPKAPSGNRYLIPWFDATGHYSLQTISLKTYDEPQFFRGKAAQIFVEPSDATGKISGSEPVGRYIRRNDGVLVPADEISLDATAVYAHFEHLREIDLGLGVQLKWPATVGIEAVMFTGEGRAKDNALYDGRFDAFLILPSDHSRLPLTLNGGVLAHEHFHGIFQSEVLLGVKGLLSPRDLSFLHACNWVTAGSEVNVEEIVKRATEKKSGLEKDTVVSSSYNAFLLRSLNEGFADFWAWVYTGDDDFLAKSLESEKVFRSLSSPPGKLFTTEQIQSELSFNSSGRNKDEERARFSYNVGTKYARFMRAAATEIYGKSATDPETRIKFAKTLVSVLPEFKNQMKTKYSVESVSPDLIVDLLSAKWKKDGLDACATLKAFKSSGAPVGCNP